MKLLTAVLQEILGLFVDDGRLAIGVLAIVAAVAGLAAMAILPPALIGFALLAALVALLAENIIRRARARR